MISRGEMILRSVCMERLPGNDMIRTHERRSRFMNGVNILEGCRDEKQKMSDLQKQF